MKQLRLQWAEPTELGAWDEVDLEPETTEAVIALMARALIAVVRAAQENADER